jgi:hypothetical protein
MPPINPDFIGKIVEFQDKFIKLTICKAEDMSKPGNEDKFILSVGPTNVNHVYRVCWNNESYSTTAEKAKEHILTALEIARISTYGPTHMIGIHVPFYPFLQMKATEIEKAIAVFKNAMDNYF